jgi:nucleoside-diphosphate-sugar epimerase
VALSRVAIVGAGGFLGTTLLRVIRRVPECEATAIVRHPRSLPLVLGLCDAIVVTQGRTDIAADAFAECDAVIDVSGGTASEIPTSALDLARSCQKAKVKRLIYTSSAAAQSLQRHRWNLERPPTYYGRQKLSAEQTLLSQLTDTEVAVFRPGLIWGPRSPWTIRHVTEIACGAVAALNGNARKTSAPNLAFSENLAAKMLAWAMSDAAGGSCYFADPWWSSWEHYFVSLAASLQIPSSNVVLARKLRAGPPSKLLFEVLLNHPEMARRAKQLLMSLPEQVVGRVKAGLRPPTPPPALNTQALASSVSGPTIIRIGRFAPRDIDVFSRWAAPVPQMEDGPYPLQIDREEALRQTASWLSESGYLEYLGIESAML